MGIDICNVMQNSCVGAYKDDDVSNSCYTMDGKNVLDVLCAVVCYKKHDRFDKNKKIRCKLLDKVFLV